MSQRARRARLLRERRELVGKAEPEACGRCHAEPAVDPHELTRRSQGGDPTDPFMVVPVGRACHTWITEHPTEAHDEGWVLWSYERDDPAAHRRAWLARIGRRAPD